jgi:hypothetical protein
VLEASVPSHERWFAFSHVQVATIEFDDALQHGVEKLCMLGLGLEFAHAPAIGSDADRL